MLDYGVEAGAELLVAALGVGEVLTVVVVDRGNTGWGVGWP